MECVIEIIFVVVSTLGIAFTLKYFHKMPSREFLYHYGASWCAANRDACATRKERMKEYLESYWQEEDNATNA